MSRSFITGVFFCAVLAVSATGCRSGREVVPLPTVEGQVEVDFDTVWASTRDVLLDEGLQLYTRDLRGLFVVYTPEKNRLRLFPTRTKATIILQPVDANTTAISVETIYQRYRVTLLTEPDWHDLPEKTDQELGPELLGKIIRRARRSAET